MSFQFGGLENVERDFERVRRALLRLPGTLGARIHGAGMAAAARVVRNHAKATAPFTDRSGRLRGSIRARRRSQKVYTLFPARGSRRITGAAAQVLVGGEGARQAFVIEFGRAPGPGYPGAPAFPFLLPAATSTRREQFSAATRALTRAFLQVAREIQSGRARPITLTHLSNQEIV